MHDPSFGLLERPGLDSGLGFQAPGMLLKAAKIEQQGLHDPSLGFLKAAKIEHQGLRDPSFGLLERPGLDSGLGFQAPGMLPKAAEIEQLN